VMTYAGCMVDKAVFAAAAGEVLTLTLDVVGKTESVAAAGTFTAPSPTLGAPLVFGDATFVLGGTARQARRFRLTIDNQLRATFRHSTTATALLATRRMVTLAVDTPYTAAEANLYDQPLAGSPASMTFAGDAASLTFDLATLQFPNRSPSVTGRGEITLRLEGIARRVGSTPELTVTLAM